MDTLKLKVKGIPESEYSVKFLQGMLNGMGVSYYKYGKVADAYPDKVNALESLKVRIERYLKTGNMEFLMDVANFAMIEFMRPSLPNAVYAPGDSDQSPGRVTTTGRRTQLKNTEIG